jgi:hypothetical protein
MPTTETAAVVGAGIPESPEGVRAARRRWRDPRLVVGALLVGASVVGMSWVISASDDTVAVWSVADDIPQGSPVGEDSLTEVRVRLADTDPYLLTSSAVPDGAVAARDFAAGELLTSLGLESADDPEVIRVVTLPVLRHQMPADLTTGDRVDVYVVERGSGGEPEGAPRLVLSSAIVADVGDDGGSFGGTSLETGVALSVPRDDVATVVEAQARGTITLVDVPVGSS